MTGSHGAAVASSTALDGPVRSTPFGALRPVGFNHVRLNADGFLGAWQYRNAAATITHLIDNLETSGVLHNFRRIADREDGVYIGMDFADTDLYKTLEAIGWESGRRGEVVEAAFVDLAVDLIGRTQAEDGYINTRVQGDPLRDRWSWLIWSHELYSAGHLFQAAIALSRGANDTRLLAVAERFAQRILSDLAERDEAYDGHSEVETALVELSRETGNRAYLDFARIQIERRGHGKLPKHPFGADYFGDHQPLDQVDEATGHAVRQLYYMTGVADLFLETGEPRYLDAAERIWDSAYSTKTYLTGGQGSRHFDESFGDPYELPADRAYAETCAGIASFQWNWRMLLATGRSKYAAEMERVLYNTIAASVGLDGCHFFYTNPLQMRTGHRGAQEGSPSERLSWFECACCPPNLARLIASLHTYVATMDDNGVQLHHLTPGVIESAVQSGAARISVHGDYPWSGHLTLHVQGEGAFELAVRIPEWAQGFSVYIDGAETDTMVRDGYLRLRRDWSSSSVVELRFGLHPELVHAHPRVDAVRGAVALVRGPLVYCLEDADQKPGSVLEDLRIDPSEPIDEIDSTAPEVKVALRTEGRLVRPGSDLYAGDGVPWRTDEAATLTAIPYFAWGNRGQGAMRIWIPTNSN